MAYGVVPDEFVDGLGIGVVLILRGAPAADIDNDGVRGRQILNNANEAKQASRHLLEWMRAPLRYAGVKISEPRSFA